MKNNSFLWVSWEKSSISTVCNNSGDIDVQSRNPALPNDRTESEPSRISSKWSRLSHANFTFITFHI